jgi:hypothetical protein
MGDCGSRTAQEQNPVWKHKPSVGYTATQEAQVGESWSKASQRKTQDPILKNKLKEKRTRGLAQVIEHFSTKQKTLSSNPSTGYNQSVALRLLMSCEFFRMTRLSTNEENYYWLLWLSNKRYNLRVFFLFFAMSIRHFIWPTIRWDNSHSQLSYFHRFQSISRSKCNVFLDLRGQTEIR